MVAIALAPAAARLNAVVEETDQAVDAAIEAAKEAGLEGDALRAVELGDALKSKNYGKMFDTLSDPVAVHQALMEAAELDAQLPGSVQARLQRATTNGMSMDEENALLNDIMLTAGTGGTAKTGQDAAEVLSDSIDALTDLMDTDGFVDEGEMAEMIRMLADMPEVYESLSDETKGLLGAWFDVDSGKTGYSDGITLMNKMVEDMNSAFYKALEGADAGVNTEVEAMFNAGLNLGSAAVKGFNSVYGGLLNAGNATPTSRSGNVYNGGNLYVGQMTMNGGTDAQALADAMNARNRRASIGYGG